MHPVHHIGKADLFFFAKQFPAATGGAGTQCIHRHLRITAFDHEGVRRTQHQVARCAQEHEAQQIGVIARLGEDDGEGALRRLAFFIGRQGNAHAQLFAGGHFHELQRQVHRVTVFRRAEVVFAADGVNGVVAVIVQVGDFGVVWCASVGVRNIGRHGWLRIPAGGRF